MAVQVKCQGPGCDVTFAAKSTRAKYHGDACRRRASRKVPAPADSDLVVAVRKELEEAGKAETYAGQLAIHLARQLSSVGSGGAVGLARELRVAMVDALGPREAAPPAPAEEDPAEEEDDELRAARRSRDAKLAALAEAQ